MKLLVQRVSKASVEVQAEKIASINKGVLVFVGFDKDDNYQKLKSLTDKLLNYKIFNDSKGKVSMYKPGERPADSAKTEVNEDNMSTDQQSS